MNVAIFAATLVGVFAVAPICAHLEYARRPKTTPLLPHRFTQPYTFAAATMAATIDACWLLATSHVQALIPICILGFVVLLGVCCSQHVVIDGIGISVNRCYLRPRWEIRWADVREVAWHASGDIMLRTAEGTAIRIPRVLRKRLLLPKIIRASVPATTLWLLDDGKAPFVPRDRLRDRMHQGICGGLIGALFGSAFGMAVTIAILKQNDTIDIAFRSALVALCSAGCAALCFAATAAFCWAGVMTSSRCRKRE